MKQTRILAVATICASAALAGCAGHDIVAPDTAASDASSVAAVHLIVPSDGPARDLNVAGAEPEIRIGVVQATSSVSLGSAADWTARDKASGLVLFTGHGGSVTVTLASVSASHYRLQVTCGSTAAVQTTKDAAEAQGIATYTEYVPAANCTRLFLGEFAANASFSVRNAFRNLMISKGLAGTDSFWKVVGVAGNTVYSVSNGATVKENTNPITLTSSTGFVTINGAVYRGTAEARVNSLASLAGINQLPLEQYLYGVVPRELGPIAFPEMEAQKAQAIVARTYAISGLGKRGSDGYDLRATTDDQVYGGYGSEYAMSNAAVDATRGTVVTYGGALISTLYFSTSGGHTADNEEAFSSSALPYLRGVPDAERGNSFVHVPTLAVFKASANPKSLRAAKEGDSESDWSSYHRWTFQWSAAEISNIVSAAVGQPVGRVLEINALERGPSGRVLRLEYVTDSGRFYATKDAIRASLRYLNASHVATNLPSTLFYVEPVLDRQSKTVTGFIAYGGGFGHGVGMSQTGAVGMAAKGHSHEEILQHYYQGVALSARY
jgi:stage II sporulation protein D